jgi:hypothetical protein
MLYCVQVCVKCVLESISKYVVVFRESKSADRVRRPEEFHFTAPSDCISALLCPVCRNSGCELDLVGTRLKVLTNTNYDAVRRALLFMQTHHSRPHVQPSTLQPSECEKKSHEEFVLSKADSKLPNDQIPAGETQIEETRVGEFCCPFCGKLPESDNESIPRSDLLIRLHIFICPRRTFTCPFGDCGATFDWKNATDTLKPYNHPKAHFQVLPLARAHARSRADLCVRSRTLAA